MWRKKNWEAACNKQDHSNHHDITDYEGRFYTFRGPEIVSVDVETGNIVERVHAVDLVRWAGDPDLAIFDASFEWFYTPSDINRQNLLELTLSDPFHLNTVDVLSQDLAGSFAIFEEGDMLVRIRKLNLVVVLRPKASRIPWYRDGLTSR